MAYSVSVQTVEEIKFVYILGLNLSQHCVLRRQLENTAQVIIPEHTFTHEEIRKRGPFLSALPH